MKNVLATIGGTLVLAIIPHVFLSIWLDIPNDLKWWLTHILLIFIIYIVESNLD